MLAAPETVEAAIQAGQQATAEEHSRLLRRRAERSHAPWAISATHLAQALLAPRADADKQFRLALDIPKASSLPPLGPDAGPRGAFSPEGVDRAVL